MKESILGSQGPNLEYSGHYHGSTLFERKVIRVGGHELTFLGVSHTAETAERRRKELEKAVEKASLVVLEVAPSAMGILKEETLRKNANEVLAKLKKGGLLAPGWTTEKMIETIKEGFEFFRVVEELAGKHGKDIVVTDPLISDEIAEESMALDENSQKLKAAFFYGYPMTIVAPFILRESKNLLSREINPNIFSDAKRKYKISRRTFLKALGGVAAAGAGISLQSTHYPVEKYSDYSLGRAENPLGPFVYESIDYRDASVAQGLDILLEPKTPIQKPLIIYGEGHRQGIQHYVQHPLERKTKLITYLPYKKAIPVTLNRWRPNPDGTWTKILERKL